jgi:hypothetical protein
MSPSTAVLAIFTSQMVKESEFCDADLRSNGEAILSE